MWNNRRSVTKKILKGIYAFCIVCGSWPIIHGFALFGAFVAIAYPIWWILFPGQTTCLFCRTKEEGEMCPACRHHVHKKISRSPRNIRSVILNMCVILCVTFLSLGMVITESRILSFFGFPQVEKTVSFLIPTKGQYRLGEIFKMQIEMSGIQSPINTVQADISYDASRLEVVDVSTKDSFANIFVQKEINNEVGFVRLTGGLASPGYKGDRGLFGTISFRGKNPGVVKVEYLPTSRVLANDKKGTNVLKEFVSIPYLILPERISQEEENNQKALTDASSVLGVSTENTQLKFYTEEKVLSASTVRDEKPRSLPVLDVSIVFKLAEQIDAFIIRVWGRMVNIVG